MEYRIQVKICGMTSEEDASACAGLGADALGFVFYPPSSRNISADKAKSIISSLPDNILTVGVFVDESPEMISEIAGHCGLKAVQLHGAESPAAVEALKGLNIKIIKAVFVNGRPSLDEMSQYEADAFLIEAPRGPIPGGTGTAWDWGRVKGLSGSYPVILAGGLNPENVTEALEASLPDAVDVSSGVEISPGRKDIEKVRRFIESVRNCSFLTTRRILYG